MQGTASLVWEEAQAAAGGNADAHRADLWDAIEEGNYPECKSDVASHDLPMDHALSSEYILTRRQGS